MKNFRLSNQTPAGKAKEVLTEYWDGVLPIDPSNIAKKLGIVVTPIGFTGYSGKAYQESNKSIIEYDSLAIAVMRFAFSVEKNTDTENCAAPVSPIVSSISELFNQIAELLRNRH